MASPCPGRPQSVGDRAWSATKLTTKRIALRTRRFGDEHGERRKRPESDQLEFHHSGDAEWKLLQEFVRLCRAGGVHDEDDAAALCLGEPLLDFSSEMIANRGANLMGADRGDRLGCALRRDRADRQDLGCRSDNGGERGQYLGMDTRILDVTHFTACSRHIGRGTTNDFAVSVKSIRSGAIG